MAQQGKNLDSLMMAYADLSGGNRGSSFKGPPLKEVKIEKAPPPVFKPSSKARDWSNIESVFDDAFVLSPMPIPTAQKVEIQSNPEFSAFSQWQEEPTPQAHFQVPLQPPPDKHQPTTGVIFKIFRARVRLTNRSFSR